MITPYTLVKGTWTAITTEDQSGSCWLAESCGYNVNDVKVLVWHGADVPTDDNVIEGKRVYTPKSNDDVMVFTADTLDLNNDVYWAIAPNDSDIVILADVN